MADTTHEVTQVEKARGKDVEGKIRVLEKTYPHRRCFKSVDSVSDCSPKLVPIDEEPDNQIVHLFRLGETDCAAYQSLDPCP
jgi:hypothetical protein